MQCHFQNINFLIDRLFVLSVFKQYIITRSKQNVSKFLPVMFEAQKQTFDSYGKEFLKNEQVNFVTASHFFVMK